MFFDEIADVSDRSASLFSDRFFAFVGLVDFPVQVACAPSNLPGTSTYAIGQISVPVFRPVPMGLATGILHYFPIILLQNGVSMLRPGAPMQRTLRPLCLATAMVWTIVGGTLETVAQSPETAPNNQAAPSNETAPRSGPLPAPVGHRQPTLEDIPSDLEEAVREGDREMRRFDRLLRICTACGLGARYGSGARATRNLRTRR